MQTLWSRWGLNHLEVLCAGGLGGAWVVGKVGLAPLALGGAITLVGSWVLRHVIRPPAPPAA